MIASQMILIATVMIGGADPTLRPAKGDRLHWAWNRSAGAPDRPSQRTLETLRICKVEDLQRRDPVAALTTLERKAKQAPSADLAYALAELSWIEGSRIERRDPAMAAERFMDAAAYAWDFLFDSEFAEARNPADPRFHLACELYNAGLRRVTLATLFGPRSNGGPIRLRYRGHDHPLTIELKSKAWKPSDIQELLLASDFEVEGLPTQIRQHGLGVPLIAVRKTAGPGEGADRYYPKEMTFALTAFLRPDSRLRDHSAPRIKPEGKPAAEGPSPHEERAYTIELIDPLATRVAGEGKDALPLEIDFTTPLAYMWSRTELRRYSLQGLFHPGEVGERAGLTLLRPYEAGKIPVVMVHGLRSSPLAWVAMLNELYRDPALASRYQFMLYFYPTGVTVPIAAAGFRQALSDAYANMRSEGDPTFDRMILLGHSMGGLLSHAVTVESGDKLWQTLTDRRIDELQGDPETIEKVKSYVTFEPLPFVKRVVFLATPHRGSDLSTKFAGKLSEILIETPDDLTTMLNRLVRENPHAFDRKRVKRLPNSIETLQADSPILLSILSMKPSKDVVYHSILGAERPGPLLSTSDGIVAYRSSHLDGVASELVVRAGHGVQKDPEAIDEIRRILRLHLQD